MGDLGGPYDAIIIGSGMSGLTSANILAKAGQKVLVLEKHYHFGGYLQNFMLHRTPFDSGCHYVGALGPGQVFDRYLRYLGVRDDITARSMDPEGFDVLEHPSWRFAIPAGYERFSERLIEHFPEEKAGITAFFETLRREITHFPMYTLTPCENPQGQSPDPDRTLAHVLGECAIQSFRLREILASFGVLYFVPAEETSFSMYAFVADSFIQGAYTIRGGGNSIQKALIAKLRSMGGIAKRRTTVTQVEVDGRNVKGVHIKGGGFAEAPLVLACIDPKAAVSLLPKDAVRPVYRNRIRRLRAGMGGFGAYLRVEGDLSRFSGSNYQIRSEEGIQALFSETWIKDKKPAPVFVTVASTREPDWTGPHAVTILTGMHETHFGKWDSSDTNERDPEYVDLKNELGELLIDAVRPYMPELDTGLVTRDYSTPLTHRDYTQNAGGAIYGIHHSVSQSGARGIGRRTRVNGFLLSGHSVLYPGLLGAMISAFYTCGDVLGLKRLHDEVLKA